MTDLLVLHKRLTQSQPPVPILPTLRPGFLRVLIPSHLHLAPALHEPRIGKVEEPRMR